MKRRRKRESAIQTLTRMVATTPKKQSKAETAVTVVLSSIICIFIIAFICKIPTKPNRTVKRQHENQLIETETSTEKTENQITKTEIPTTETEIHEKSIDDLDLTFVGSVLNDATGNWRYSTMNGSDADFQEYAVSYYKKYMKENEVHAIINKECGHTIRINNLGDHALSVDFLEYHDGEENDASELFGGDLIDEYMITIETGEIEHIEQEEGSETEEQTIKDTESAPKILHFILNTDTNCVHESERCSAAEAIDPVNRAEIDIPENELKNYQGVYWACGKCCSGSMKTMLPKPES